MFTKYAFYGDRKQQLSCRVEVYFCKTPLGYRISESVLSLLNFLFTDTTAARYYRYNFKNAEYKQLQHEEMYPKKGLGIPK